MKVYQIISEAPPAQKPSARIQTRQATVAQQAAQQQAATQAAQQQAATAAQQTAAQQKAAQQAAMTPKQAAQAKVDKISAAADRMQKGTINPARKNDIRMLKNKKIKDVWDQLKGIETAKGLEKYNKFLGTTLGKTLSWGLNFVGFAIIVKDYYGVIGYLEENYENGNLGDDLIPGQTAEQTFRSWIAEANGVLTQQLVVLAAHVAADVKIAAQVAKGIIRVAGISSSAATLGASIAALLVTEAGFLALETFLTTDRGKKWLAIDLLLAAVTSLGSAEALVWDGMTDYFEKQNLKRSTYAATAAKKELDAAKLTNDPAVIAAAQTKFAAATKQIAAAADEKAAAALRAEYNKK